MTEDDEKAEKDDEDTPIRRSRRTDRKSDQRNENDSTNWVRRSSRQTKSTTSDGNDAELEGCLSDGTHHSPENGVRRSKRAHHKPSFYDPVAYEKPQSSSDDKMKKTRRRKKMTTTMTRRKVCFKSFLSL